MDILLLALLCLSLAALATIAWYMRKKLRRFEARFNDFKSLRFMPDRLQSLSKKFDSLQLEEIDAELDSIRATLRRIEDLASAPSSQLSGDESGVSRPQAVRALVSRELLAREYVDVVISSDDDSLSGDRVEVALTAKRRGASVAGTVIVDNQTLCDINLKANYTTFP
ncbi:MAG: hypothetical protein QGF46_06140 [Planctomycetota bacterium]|jgi:hypothetical protein|nr:hypothetical protein [Planctomycetota bacterium]